MSDFSYQDRWLSVRATLVTELRKKCGSTASLRDKERAIRNDLPRRAELGKSGDGDGESFLQTTGAEVEIFQGICSQIEAAIAHGDAGRYGECIEEDCLSDDGMISEARLKAKTYAIRCTACAERREEVVIDALPRKRFRLADRHKNAPKRASF